MARVPWVNVLARSIIVLSLTWLLAGCAALGIDYQRPELSLVNVRSLGGSGIDQRFSLSFRIDNPNPVSLPVSGIDYQVALNGMRFVTGATDRDFTIAAHGDTVFDVAVEANLLDSARVLLDLFRQRRDRVDYSLDARIHTGLALMRSVDVGRSGTVSLSGR